MLSLDNRREKRTQTLIPAFASDLDDRFVLKCLIRDVSRGGCRLVSSDIDDLPEIVHIVPEGFDKPLLGKIVWRRTKMAGVRFIDRTELAALTAKAPAQEPLGFLSRFQIFSSHGLPGRGPASQPRNWERTGVPDTRVSTVIHALRTRLASALGALRFLANGVLGKLPRKVQSIVDGASGDARRLAELLDDLPDAGIAGAKAPAFDFATIDIVALVRRAIAAEGHSGAKHGVAFRVEDEVGQALVHTDAGRIETVLENLLSNAARLSPPGETVTVNVRRVGDKIRIAVSDKGQRILAGARNKNIDASVQAGQPSARSMQGKRLGPNGSQMIAEQRASPIRIESEPGSGTTAWFELTAVKGATEQVFVCD